MKTKLSLPMFAVVMALSFSASAQAPQPIVTKTPNQLQAHAAASAKASAKRRKGKSAKPFSKATLSAFEPISTLSDQTPSQSAASTALSPMLSNDSKTSLRPEQSRADEGSSSGLAIQAQTQGPYAEDLTDVSAAQANAFDRNVESTESISGNDALGAEPISVIDRVSSKPKASGIAQGPLKLRVKGSGVGASVQIPLTAGN